MNHPIIYKLAKLSADYFAITRHSEEYTFNGQSTVLTYWHRPLHAMTDAFTEAGFRISVISEPPASPTRRASSSRPTSATGQRFCASSSSSSKQAEFAFQLPPPPRTSDNVRSGIQRVMQPMLTILRLQTLARDPRDLRPAQRSAACSPATTWSGKGRPSRGATLSPPGGVEPRRGALRAIDASAWPFLADLRSAPPPAAIQA